ncbi:MAG: M48 family metalloprotease [Alphaproteobacteria bacterium]|nr:M48 family metalloprotease [Alphaproteobacteria bacterium]
MIVKPRLLLPRLLAVAIVTGLAACSSLLSGSDIAVNRTGETNAAPAVPAGTDPDDVVVGRREHPRILVAYGGVYQDEAAEIMLARITGKLLAAADQPNTPYTVTILDTADVNAFALPGGFIYVTRGLLALANDESEIAAVVAHEIAHVTLKHARARSSRARTSEIVDRVITGVLGGDLETDQSAARSRLSLAAFSQAQEISADKEGVRVAARAGYDPNAAARFLSSMGRFAAMAAAAESQGDDFLASHPSTPDRIEKVLNEAMAFAPLVAAARTDRGGYFKAIDGLAFGDSPNQGAVVGQQFIHPALGFTFTVPKGYSLQNSLAAVVGLAGDGEAVRFDSAEVPESMALPDYLKSGWIAGLDAASVRSENHNGVDMASGTAFAGQWHFRVTALRFKGDVYRYIFASRTGDDAFAKRAEQVVASFREAQAEDTRKIRRTVVRIATARPGDTTRSLSDRMTGVANGSELFLVLNSLFDNDPIAPGENYKIIAVE